MRSCVNITFNPCKDLYMLFISSLHNFSRLRNNCQVYIFFAHTYQASHTSKSQKNIQNSSQISRQLKIPTSRLSIYFFLNSLYLNTWQYGVYSLFVVRNICFGKLFLLVNFPLLCHGKLFWQIPDALSVSLN